MNVFSLSSVAFDALSYTERESPLITMKRPFTLWDTSCHQNAKVAYTGSNKKNPINDWLISEKLFRNDLALRSDQTLTRGETELKEPLDVSRIASSTLEEFLSQSFAATPSTTDARFVEQRRNVMMLESFLRCDGSHSPKGAQVSLLM